MVDPLTEPAEPLSSLPLRFEQSSGLLPAIAQDHVTGEVRMLAWANADAIRATLETGRATFFSRSRSELWEKGKTSSNVLDVTAVLVDCDADAVVYLVTPHGPTCHTGKPTCFFRRLLPNGELLEEEISGSTSLGTTTLARLDGVIASKKADTAEKSYTKSLYDGGPSKIGDKLREEAAELAQAVAGEDEKRVISEAADVLFHVMVALRSRNVGIGDVMRELERRAGTSGHEEKKKRSRT